MIATQIHFYDREGRVIGNYYFIFSIGKHKVISLFSIALLLIIIYLVLPEANEREMGFPQILWTQYKTIYSNKSLEIEDQN